MVTKIEVDIAESIPGQILYLFSVGQWDIVEQRLINTVLEQYPGAVVKQFYGYSIPTGARLVLEVDDSAIPSEIRSAFAFTIPILIALVILAIAFYWITVSNIRVYVEKSQIQADKKEIAQKALDLCNGDPACIENVTRLTSNWDKDGFDINTLIGLGMVAVGGILILQFMQVVKK